MSKRDVISRRDDDFRNWNLMPRSFGELRREMDRLFEDFYSGGERLPMLQRGWSGKLPSIDETEDDKAYEVKMDLPGLEEKDVEITFENGVLTVKGEKNAEEEHKDKDVWRRERSFGSFRRSVHLPVEVDDGRIEASFDKGVLTITLPKSESARAKARKIEVKKA